MKRFNLFNHGKRLLVFLFACALASPMATVYAKDNVSAIKAAAERKKGELLEAGKTSLNDAALALEAALGIRKLEGDQLWAADLLDQGGVTLDDAKIILCAALGIEEVETALLRNADYVVKNYLSVEAKTDQQVYQPGNNISLKLMIKNNASVPIFAMFEGSRCTECVLADENDQVYAYDRRFDQGITNDIGYFLLRQDEPLELERVIYEIPAHLKMEDLESKKFYIKIDFKYTDFFDLNDPNASYDLKNYSVKIPVAITN